MIQLAEIKQGLKTARVLPLYVFTGPEVAIMDIYIKQIAASIGAEIFNLDTMAAVKERCSSRRMLSGNRRMFVVRNDKSYQSAEKIWGVFKSGLVQKDTPIILVYSSLDKRTKFYKQHEEVMVDFQPLSPQVLCKYIQKEINLSDTDAVYLAEICDCNYSRILLECDKISMLANSRKINHEQALDILLTEGLIYVPPKDAIFDLVDSICRGMIRTSYLYLQDCINIGEFPLAILSVLYTNIRSIYIVKMDGGEDGVVERTGLTPFQVKLAKEKQNAYSVSELLSAMKVVREAEKCIKTGAIDADFAVPYAMTKILGGEGFPF